ncbi:hypothetical protein [uncultured Tateyamaria sp.]|uniref:spike base protein, RCAP_Rcc01079 family n=1 Tax=uncultured Tateyamaria sp. TaxID=455651 RepID=UPI00262CD3FF|nr:hypothetical protein [uncultured Tateyamaria sp.]
MADTFQEYTPGLESPASYLTAVVPDDATDLAVASRALNVAQSGFVRVTTVGGDEATVFVAAGGAFPVRAQRVWQTGTTATNIVAMY